MATRVMGVGGGPGGRAPLPEPSGRSCRSGICSAGVRWAGTSGCSAGTAMAGPGRVATSAPAMTSGRAMASGRPATSGRAMTSGRAATSDDGVPVAAAIAPKVATGTARSASAGRGCTREGSMAGRAICAGGSGPLLAPGTRRGRGASAAGGGAACSCSGASSSYSCSGASSSSKSSASRIRRRTGSGSTKGWVNPLPHPGLSPGRWRLASGARRGRGGTWLSSATGQQLPVQDAAILARGAHNAPLIN
jgi:hypothetical protein